MVEKERPYGYKEDTGKFYVFKKPEEKTQWYIMPNNKDNLEKQKEEAELIVESLGLEDYLYPPNPSGDDFYSKVGEYKKKPVYKIKIEDSPLIEAFKDPLFKDLSIPEQTHKMIHLLMLLWNYKDKNL